MKKILGIVVLGLLLSGNAYAELIKFNCYDSVDKNKFKKYTQTINFKEKKVIEDVVLTEYGKKKYKYKVREFITSYPISYSDNETVIFGRDGFTYNWKYNENISSYSITSNDGNTRESNNRCVKFMDTEISEKNEIMFTIKDKREQCEAIGFKPETEKFADCVLRLVELDVRKQQDQKIASAQNSGNMEIANQLLQMRNDNNAQYLMNLGQQLLKPQQFNSNIYLPQTQNCFLQGFDSFAKMTCR